MGSEVQAKDNRGLAQILLVIFGLLGVFLGFFSWAVSSPIGGSPDEDYHLGSIWCPRPVYDSGCEVVERDDGTLAFMVPETVSELVKCNAFKSEESSACIYELSDERYVETTRVDLGNYPLGYYQFQHLLVGRDVQQSVIWMRIANVIIGLGGLSLVALLSPPRLRRNLLVASLVSWVPMGVYFIASLNPTSWSISGILIYGAALLSASQDEVTGKRRFALLVLAVFGAALSIMSRPDSAFYVFVASLAMWILIPVTRRTVAELSLSVFVSLWGLLTFLSSGQAGLLTSDGGWPTDLTLSYPKLLLANVLSLPEYTVGFWGVGTTPGWSDVRLLGWSTFTMVFLAGGVFMVGAKQMWCRKALSSLVIAGALLGIPVVSMTMRHVARSYYYQPRYTLPLLAVFFLIWLMTDSKAKALFRRGLQLWAVVAITSVSNILALHQVVLRYSAGHDGDPLDTFFTAGAVEWWPVSASPTFVVLGGSAALMAGVFALFVALARSDRNLEEDGLLESA